MSKKLKFVKENIKLSDLVFSTKFQAREKINNEAKNDYAEIAKEAIAKGADIPLPPIRAIRRDSEVLVFSGYTRGAAYKTVEGITTVAVEVADSPDITDAEIFRLSSEANLQHGARLTNEDKRHNLLKFLKFPEYVAMANTALVPYIGASEGFIRKHRPKHLTPDYVQTTRNGKPVKVKTGNIGKKTGKKKAAATAPAAASTDVAAAEAAALDGIAGTTGSVPTDATGTTTTPPVTTKTSEVDAALDRVCKVVQAAGIYDGEALKAAVNTGTLPLSNSDIKEWAGASDKRVAGIALLVINNRWKPRKAYDFIDKEISSKTSVEHLVNSAIASGKGYCVGVGANVFERVCDVKTAGGKSYFATVIDCEKNNVTIDPATGVITITPIAK